MINTVVKFWKPVLCIIAAVAIFSGCSSINEDVSVTEESCTSEIKSETEKINEPTKNCPKHVVALSKSLGDLWLLSGGELVGITDDGLDLEGLSEDVVSIGTISGPSEEAIIGLDPDFVLMTADIPAHKELKEKLESLGIEVKAVDLGSFDDYDEIIKEFTGLTGREDLYEKNVVQIRNKVEELLQKYEKSDVTVKDKTYLCMRVSATKNKALKSDYFACDILNDFGMVNIADDESLLSELSLEAIAAADPDYIFVIYQGEEEEALKVYEEMFTSQAAWKNLSAVKEEHTYLLPKDLFQYKPNARWAEAYNYIYETYN